MSKVNVWGYFKISLKLILLGIVTALIYGILGLILMTVLVAAPNIGLISLIILIPLALIINGYLAYKLFRWK